MRTRASFWWALVAFGVAGSCDGDRTERSDGDALVLGVRSAIDVDELELRLREVGNEGAPVYVPRSIVVPHHRFVLGGSDVEPLRIRVDLARPGDYVVRLVGRGPGGTSHFTGCYVVSGVTEDADVVMGSLRVYDADGDGSPEDADAFCVALEAAGGPVACGAARCESLQEDCAPDDTARHPFAAETCGNGVDEDCTGADVACARPPPDCEPPDGDGGERPQCTCGGDVCAPNETCCDDACVDTASDASSCGGCGQACDGLLADGCRGGACVCGAGAACGPGAHCEGGACGCDRMRGDCNDDPSDGCETALGADPTRCGACDNGCNPAEVCVGGRCLCGDDVPCGPASTCDGAGCVCEPGHADCVGGRADGCEQDVLRDETACGGCGVTCERGESCNDGVCQCGQGPSCGNGFVCDDDRCECDDDDACDGGGLLSECRGNGRCRCGLRECDRGEWCTLGGCEPP